MEPEETSLPGNRWGLTAPVSYVLLYVPRKGSGQAFKIALLELVAREWLKVGEVEERGFLGSRRSPS
jgi:hypothetical protein